ncbi:MAG: hypothetical protein ACK47F_12910, partial [Flavobacteriales bacterium]
MKINYKLVIILLLPLLQSCLFKDNCKKINLRSDEKIWFDSFRKGKIFSFVSNKGNTDDFECSELLNEYTLCNRIEKGDFSYNEVMMELSSLKKRKNRIAMFFSK